MHVWEITRLNRCLYVSILCLLVHIKYIFVATLWWRLVQDYDILSGHLCVIGLFLHLLLATTKEGLYNLEQSIITITDADTFNTSMIIVLGCNFYFSW